MDEELTPLQMEFEARRKKPPPTPLQQEYEARKSRPVDEEGVAGRARGLVQSGLQGLTLGFGDELVAGTRAVLPEALGGTKGFDYSGAVKEERESLGQFRGKHPVAATVAELAGGVLPAVATGGAALRGASYAKRLGAGAKAGAKFGAVAGTGTAEGGVGQRVAGAAKGAALGTAVGAAVPLFGSVLGKTADVTGMRTRATAASRADDLLLRAFKRDETSIPQLRVAAQDATAATKPRILPDLAGENTRGLAQAAQSTPSLAKNQLKRTLDERHAGQLGRITDDLESSLNTKGRDVYEVGEEIVARQKTTAAPLYEKAYQRGMIEDGEIAKLLRRPAGKKALASARALAADEGVPLPSPWLDVRTLDYVKRALDDRIGPLKQKGVKDKARILTRLKNDLLDRVDKIVPEFKAARQAFKGDAEMNDALALGREFLNEDHRLSARTVAQLTDPEKEMYRVGAIDAIRQKMEKSSDRWDLVKKIFDSPDQKAKLRVLFPDEQSYNQFAKGMEHEANMVKTKEGILSGSNTANKIAGMSDMADIAVSAGAGPFGVQGATVQALRALLKRRAQGVAGNVADDLSQSMMASPQDAVQFSGLLDRLERGQLQPLVKSNRFAKLLGSSAGAASNR